MRTPEQIEKEQAVDRAYKDSLKKIPDAKPADPWGNARSTDAPKAAAKTPAGKSHRLRPVTRQIKAHDGNPTRLETGI